MSMAVAALFADGESIIDDVGCVDTSYPGFVDMLRSLAPRATVLVESRGGA
jgi:3-phosphoshikimate 1-carboxyvinyltransferase